MASAPAQHNPTLKANDEAYLFDVASRNKFNLQPGITLILQRDQVQKRIDMKGRLVTRPMEPGEEFDHQKSYFIQVAGAIQDRINETLVPLDVPADDEVHKFNQGAMTLVDIKYHPLKVTEIGMNIRKFIRGCKFELMMLLVLKLRLFQTTMMQASLT